MQQSLLLDLFNKTLSFDNFIKLNNKEVCSLLLESRSQFINIIGTPLSGKTHLLKAWINKHLENNQRAIYLNSEKLFINDIAEFVVRYDYIAIDNIDMLDANGQLQLFDLFNYIKLNNFATVHLLTSSNVNLESCTNMRNDLKTRILSGLNLALKAPNDDELLDALFIYANTTGIKIETQELNYLISHLPRNIGLLINTVDNISLEAIRQNRHITIPLIRSALNLSTKI